MITVGPLAWLVRIALKRRLGLYIFLVAALLETGALQSCAVPASDAPRRLAVIVGVVHAHQRLQFPVNDARLFRDAIGGPDTDVTLLVSDGSGNGLPTRENIVKAVRDTIMKARPQDSVWFYYSGHGQRWDVDGRSYLLPQDFVVGEMSSYLAISDIRKELAADSHAKLNVVVIDACQSGSSKGGAIASLEQTFGDARGVITLASCEAGQASWEFPALQCSVFTFFLTRGLAGGDAPDSSRPVSRKWLQDYVKNSIAVYLERERQLDPAMGDVKQTPVFIPSDASGDPFGVPNPVFLDRHPRVAANAAIRLREPLPPGVIVTMRGGADASTSISQAETLIRDRLIAEQYPVVDKEQAGPFEAVLNDRDTEVAAEQARRMNCRFLLRGEMICNVRAVTIGTEELYTAEVTENISVIDSDGAIPVSKTSDSDAGAPVTRVSSTADRALRLAVATATQAVMAKVSPEMHQRLRDRLTLQSQP